MNEKEKSEEYFQRKLTGNEPVKRLDGKPIFLSTSPPDFHVTRSYRNANNPPEISILDNSAWIPADALPVVHHDYCSNLSDVDSGGCDDGI